MIRAQSRTYVKVVLDLEALPKIYFGSQRSVFVELSRVLSPCALYEMHTRVAGGPRKEAAGAAEVSSAVAVIPVSSGTVSAINGFATQT